MPGPFVAAELILTCYLTESPWIIIFGSDRQVENVIFPQSRVKSHENRLGDKSCNTNPRV